MRRQLSTEYYYLQPLQFAVAGLAVGAGIVCFFISDVSWLGKFASVLILLLAGLTAFYFGARLYKVSFDSDFLYFSRFGQEKKVPLEKVSNIKVSVLPWPIFYLTSYPVTISYTENDSIKKVRFLSRGIFRIVASIRQIPLLDTLKQYIREKKYGR